MSGRCYAPDRRSTLYDQPHGRPPPTGRHAAPGNWPDAWGSTTTTCSWCSGAGSPGAAEVLGAGETSVPLDTLPFFPPYTAGGHRAHALVGRPRRGAAPGPRRAVPPVRGPDARRGGPSPAHGHRRRLPHRHPHRGRRRHPGRPRHRIRHGRRRPSEPHGAQPAASAPTSSTWPTPIRPRLRACALATAEPAASVLAARPGVYAQLPGPQFETPAEIRMLRTAGADVVGMSMALETIAARQAGAEVLGLAAGHQPRRDRRTRPSRSRPSPRCRAAAVPAVAAIIRHVVGSLP